MLVSFVSFFNEVATETRKLSSQLVSFFNELEIRKPCSRLVSFFNELEIRKPCLKMVSFFNELEIKKPCSKSLFLIMDSKRTMLWKDTMSRDKTRSWLPRDLHLMEETHSGKENMSRVTIGVRRSGSNSPTEEITMSTTRSKS
jgi:hypothetical protein